VLLRLEHFYAKDEDPVLSQPAKIKLKVHADWLFIGVTLFTVKHRCQNVRLITIPGNYNPFNGSLFRTTQVSRYQKITFIHALPLWILSNILKLISLIYIASSLFSLRISLQIFFCLPFSVRSPCISLPSYFFLFYCFIKTTKTLVL